MPCGMKKVKKKPLNHGGVSCLSPLYVWLCTCANLRNGSASCSLGDRTVGIDACEGVRTLRELVRQFADGPSYALLTG